MPEPRSDPTQVGCDPRPDAASVTRIGADSGRSRWGAGLTADQMHEMRWTRPKLVVQVRFVEWTTENRLRHAAYLDERSDKDAREVVREA